MRLSAHAPGKVILFGEHAVVYGRPAIAAPVTMVRATAQIEPAPPGSGLTLIAADLERRIALSTADVGDPLAAAARLTLEHLGVGVPDAILTIRSDLPIASGLGSGAAVSTALVRALSGFLGHSLPPATVSSLVFEVEKIHHGTPSGIDNTVIAYEQLVYFVRGEPPTIERLSVGVPFSLLIADTGLPSPTKQVVMDVRLGWQQAPAHHEALFDQIGEVVDEARRMIEGGDVDALGLLMSENHELLIELGVSSSLLNKLVDEAHLAGALGAKLSGAGRGGNMIALVEEDDSAEVAEALREAGATKVIQTALAANLEAKRGFEASQKSSAMES